MLLPSAHLRGNLQISPIETEVKARILWSQAPGHRAVSDRARNDSQETKHLLWTRSLLVSPQNLYFETRTPNVIGSGGWSPPIGMSRKTLASLSFSLFPHPAPTPMGGHKKRAITHQEVGGHRTPDLPTQRPWTLQPPELREISVCR